MFREQVINYIDKFLSNRGFNLTKEGDKTAQQLYYSKKENIEKIANEFITFINRMPFPSLKNGKIYRFCMNILKIKQKKSCGIF